MQYVYEKASATGPYTRPAGTYTRYGDVLPLLTATDDKLAVFGSGDEVHLISIRRRCRRCLEDGCAIISLPRMGTRKTWISMRRMGTCCAAAVSEHGRLSIRAEEMFPLDDTHVNYFWNTTRGTCRGTNSEGIGSITALRDKRLQH